MHDLPDDGTDRPAGLDDWPFRTERSAGADRDGGRDRLENRNSRRNSTAVHQHRFHGFWNSVAFDLGCPVFRHDGNDDATDGWEQDDPGTQRVHARADELGGQAVVEEEVSEKANHPVERPGHHARNQTDACGQKRNQHHPKLSGLGEGDVAHLGSGGCEGGGRRIFSAIVFV